MKRILLTLLAVMVVLGIFAATGYAGYRLGYTRGVQSVANGDELRPKFRSSEEWGPRGMPMQRFGPEPGWGRGNPMMGPGFFRPWVFLVQVAVLVLIGGLIHWLFIRSGWRLTRQTIVSDNSSKTENE